MEKEKILRVVAMLRSFEDVQHIIMFPAYEINVSTRPRRDIQLYIPTYECIEKVLNTPF